MRPVTPSASRCPEPEAGLAAGILIGLRERVDRSLAADFATAGASHVVAISGWNIAIVAGLVGAVMRGRPRRVVAIVVGGTILAYVLAAGASPSVVRAAVMAGVVLLARESGRAGRAPAALALAAFAMLVAEPAMIGDAGFRLSVVATAGLLAWGTPLGRWIGGLAGGRIPGWLAEGLGISLAAQAATLPDVLVTFGRLSLVAPAVNLAVVPAGARGDGRRRPGDGRWRPGDARPPGRRGDDPRAAGLAAAARHRGGRADRGRSAVRRGRDPARGRPGGGARGRRRWSWRHPRSCAGSARGGHGGRGPARHRASGARARAARTRRSSPIPASRGARALAVVAAIVVALSTIALGRHRRPDDPPRDARRRARATRSSSRAGPAAGCWWTAGRTRSGCSSSSMRASRRGIAGSTSSC